MHKPTILKKLTVLFFVLTFILTNVIPVSAEEEDMVYTSQASEIIDIANHWANQYIFALVDREILSGYPDKTFRPDNQITRGEYLTALFKTACVLDEAIVSEDIPYGMGYFYFYDFRENGRREFLQSFPSADYELSYGDMKNHWSKNYVGWVKNYYDKKEPGLFEKIFPGENFYPNQPITREEAALVTTAFLALPVRSRGIEFEDVTPDYVFYNEIMDLVDNGIISGYPDGTFRPKENITRAAAAVIMTNVLKEIAYNMDFFADVNTYTSVIYSSNDSDYVASFMPEEMYQNPPTELDKRYVAEFKAYELDQQMAQELMNIEMVYDPEEQDLDEYNAMIEEIEKSIWEKYEKLKREIPYYEPEKDSLEVFKELEQEDYWNKAGLYYWIYQCDPLCPIEFLEKAEAAYQIDKNGKDDLYKIYESFISYYVYQDKNAKKAIEYIDKADGLFIPDENGEAKIANMVDIRFYTFAAYYLADLGEYEKALYYIEKYFDKFDAIDVYEDLNFSLERGVLMCLCGQRDKAVIYLREKLKILEQEEYMDENLRDKYIWALKSIERL